MKPGVREGRGGLSNSRQGRRGRGATSDVRLARRAQGKLDGPQTEGKWILSGPWTKPKLEAGTTDDPDW